MDAIVKREGRSCEVRRGEDRRGEEVVVGLGFLLSLACWKRMTSTRHVHGNESRSRQMNWY